jgi:hypothetical protein
MKYWMFLIGTAASLAAAMPAAAACSWEWLCNGEGQCKHMPVCESVYETPPPRPEGAEPPAMPPLAMRPFKIAGAGVGSSTTLTCEHIMRKGKSGRWYWHEACFCTDPGKAKDHSGPFANIVRCDNP